MAASKENLSGSFAPIVLVRTILGAGRFNMEKKELLRHVLDSRKFYLTIKQEIKKTTE